MTDIIICSALCIVCFILTVSNLVLFWLIHNQLGKRIKYLEEYREGEENEKTEKSKTEAPTINKESLKALQVIKEKCGDELNVIETSLVHYLDLLSIIQSLNLNPHNLYDLRESLDFLKRMRNGELVCMTIDNYDRMMNDFAKLKKMQEEGKLK